MKTATVGYSAAVLLLVVALVAPAAALKADQVTAISNGESSNEETDHIVLGHPRVTCIWP